MTYKSVEHIASSPESPDHAFMKRAIAAGALVVGLGTLPAANPEANVVPPLPNHLAAERIATRNYAKCEIGQVGKPQPEAPDSLFAMGRARAAVPITLKLTPDPQTARERVWHAAEEDDVHWKLPELKTHAIVPAGNGKVKLHPIVSMPVTATQSKEAPDPTNAMLHPLKSNPAGTQTVLYVAGHASGTDPATKRSVTYSAEQYCATFEATMVEGNIAWKVVPKPPELPQTIVAKPEYGSAPTE